MGKLYTIDHKLLTDTPEIRIGDKVYPVDDRQKTVEKVNQLIKKEDLEEFELIREVLSITLGKKAAEEIDKANYRFEGQKAIMETVIAAMTGEDPKDVAKRFQPKGEDTADT